jgi:hypothetical protein
MPIIEITVGGTSPAAVRIMSAFTDCADSPMGDPESVQYGMTEERIQTVCQDIPEAKFIETEQKITGEG